MLGRSWTYEDVIDAEVDVLLVVVEDVRNVDSEVFRAWD